MKSEVKIFDIAFSYLVLHTLFSALRGEFQAICVENFTRGNIEKPKFKTIKKNSNCQNFSLSVTSQENDVNKECILLSVIEF